MKSQSIWGMNRFIIITLSLLISGAMFAVINLFNAAALIEDLELKTYDFRTSIPFGNTPYEQASPDIGIVTFDDPTLNVYQEEYGTWPWPRKIHADMIRFMNAAGAKALAYDIMFVGSQKGQETSDQALIDAFKEFKNVYFSMNLSNTGNLQANTKKTSLSDIHALSIPLKNQLKPGQGETLLDSTGFFSNEAMSFDTVRTILPDLIKVQDRIAFINHGRDKDGVSRSNPLIFRYLYPAPLYSSYPPFNKNLATGQWEDTHHNRVSPQGVLMDADGNLQGQMVADYFPYLGLKLSLDLSHLPRTTSLAVTPQGHLQYPGHDVPLSSQGNMLIHWYGSSRLLAQNTIDGNPYLEIPAWKILKAIHNEKAGQLTPQDQRLKAQIKGKILFIGTTAASLYDVKTTPINKLLPGVVLQATVFDNLYQNNFYVHRASQFLNNTLAACLCLIIALVIFRMRSALASLLSVVMLVVIYSIVVLWLFKNTGLWLNVAMPIVFVVITTTLCFMAKYISRNQEYELTYQLATTDGLTELYNHRYFQDRMTQSIHNAQRFTTKFSLVLIDIDFFKKFNDTHGHQAGDEVLRQVAKKLKSCVRNQDLVARYGGEEMAVILDKVSEAEALEIANKLVKKVAEEAYLIAEGVRKNVTISVGVATYPTHGKNTTELIEFADQGLYRAKENGRNQVGAQFDPESPPTA